MRNIVYTILILVCVSSCITKKELAYMQNENLKKNIPTTFNTTSREYRLQSSDVLSVKVLSAQSEIADPFNIMNPNSGFGFSEGGSLYLNGYSIDKEGNITLPKVGKVKVGGLTMAEAIDVIQNKVEYYITDATVIAKLISFKISVIGEVRSPGYYQVFNEQANLFEGLAMAGDLTTAADRKTVKLVRQKPGSSEVILLDLTDPNLVQSHYYYLQPNDVIYVEPRSKYLGRENLGLAGTIFGLVSTTILLLNYFR
jgi:polysaccharide biosynthesis/export protein